MNIKTEQPQGCKVDCRIAVVVRPLQEYQAMKCADIWREMSVLGIGAQAGVDALNKVENSIGPVIMELGIRIERDIATANPTMTPVDLAAATLSAFNGAINTEVAFLRQNHGWDKTDLPKVEHVAVRKIRGALEFGGSLRELGTTNKCSDFARDMKKERDNKAKAALDKIRGVAGAANDVAPEGYEVDFPPELRPQVEQFLELLKRAALADAVNTSASLNKAHNALNNIVQTATARLAKTAAAA